MNQRILELADQAAEDVPGAHMNIPDEFCKKFAELLIREYSYDVMNLHGAKPERVQYAAKCWGVEV
ncbi:hypothetical protein UFOVP242_223 [uncultured Caudovirales phage]|uniref:Uncharacterized protein n=1 Tax=uncultured Caudovirales phage TaxID=2100421 RepID=A0A6J7WV79_9CAUD|nr:hypothetical protein UFOVP242_223 [uncultured Caudovirales phage]